MLNLSSRRQLHHNANLADRLGRLLAELDQLPVRDQPVTSGFAGQARRLIREADSALGARPSPLGDSSRNPAEIFAAALLNFTRLNRLEPQQFRASQAASIETYPRRLPPR